MLSTRMASLPGPAGSSRLPILGPIKTSASLARSAFRPQWRNYYEPATDGPSLGSTRPLDNGLNFASSFGRPHSTWTIALTVCSKKSTRSNARSTTSQQKWVARDMETSLGALVRWPAPNRRAIPQRRRQDDQPTGRSVGRSCAQGHDA